MNITAKDTSLTAADLYHKTPHFTERQRQRRISDERIWLALNWGQTYYQGDQKVYFLGRKQLGRAQRVLGKMFSEDEMQKADGTVVVVANDNALVTTYRNPNYIRHLRRCVA